MSRYSMRADFRCTVEHHSGRSCFDRLTNLCSFQSSILGNLNCTPGKGSSATFSFKVIESCGLTAVLHDPQFDVLVLKSAQTLEQQAGTVPVHGEAAQLPQWFMSEAKSVQFPEQHTGLGELHLK